jgi:nitroreductase
MPITSTDRSGPGPTAGPDGPSHELESLEAVAWRRRSNLRVDPDRPVPLGLVERLCRLASWAPNHHKTRPWKFCVVTGSGRTALGSALAQDLIAAGEQNPAKVSKARLKYTRAPMMLVVASADGPDEVCTLENRDAVSAAVQNLLLGATAAGLATLWSTGAAARSDRVAEVCGFEPTDTIVGLVYLGWPIADANAPVDRPEPFLCVLDDDPSPDPTT